MTDPLKLLDDPAHHKAQFDEARRYILELTENQIGTGPSPVSVVIAMHSELRRENARLREALAQARDGAFEKIGSTELIRGLLRLLREGYGPGGGYYEPHQRAAAAEALLSVGWGKSDG